MDERDGIHQCNWSLGKEEEVGLGMERDNFFFFFGNAHKNSSCFDSVAIKARLL